MFGNGLSSSPVQPRGLSHPRHRPGQCRDAAHGVAGAVWHRARRLRLRLVHGRLAGLSLGGLPGAVDRIVVNCGVSRTAVHNQVFLRSLMATLEAAPQHVGNGRFAAEPGPPSAPSAGSTPAWALSQDFYRAGSASVVEFAAEPRLAGPGDVLAHRLGGPVRRPPRRQPLRAVDDVGRGGHQRERACMTAIWTGVARDQGAMCC